MVRTTMKELEARINQLEEDQNVIAAACTRILELTSGQATIQTAMIERLITVIESGPGPLPGGSDVLIGYG
jgi:hypothetical protein